MREKGTVPTDCLVSYPLWDPFLDVPRFKALLPLILPKLSSPPDPARLFDKALEANCRVVKSADVHDPTAVLDLLNWLVGFGYPVSSLSWSALIAAAAKRWGRAERAERGLRPLLAWFEEHGVPMENSQRVYSELKERTREFRLDGEGAKVICDLLRSHGAVIGSMEEHLVDNIVFM